MVYKTIKSFINLQILAVVLFLFSNVSTKGKIDSALLLHRNMNLKDLTLISPHPCDTSLEVDFLYIIHTAPDHSELRNALRNGWASSEIQPGKTRRVFLIGRSNATLEESIIKEHELFGDIFMYNKVDAYRNMTIKVNPFFLNFAFVTYSLEIIINQIIGSNVQ